MNTATVGNGKAIHATADDEVTLCGKEVGALLIISEDVSCKACLRATESHESEPSTKGADEPSEDESEAENGATEVEASDVKAGDVLAFRGIGQHKVVQVGPVKFGHVKLTLEGGQVIKYRADHPLAKVG